LPVSQIVARSNHLPSCHLRRLYHHLQIEMRVYSLGSLADSQEVAHAVDREIVRMGTAPRGCRTTPHGRAGAEPLP
jgi:hypothetical protein